MELYALHAEALKSVEQQEGCMNVEGVPGRLL